MFEFSAPAREAVRTLREKRKTLSVMESCTGGLVSSLLTDIEGASEVFPCGLVTYSNAAKTASGVDAAVLEKDGVYSAACAEAMARAVQKQFGTDYAVGITGTLGRIDPANADSTPGEVFFCILRRGGISIPAAATQEKAPLCKGSWHEAPEGLSPAAAEALAAERLELDPTLPRPEAKLRVAEAVFARLLSLLQ